MSNWIKKRPTLGSILGLQAALDGKVPMTRTVNGLALGSDISLTKSSVGLTSVDNISDVNKPVSTDTQTALNDKISATTTINGQPLSGNVTLTKSDVGLGNVDNTSDANKPVSTATQTALDSKVPITRTVNGKALSSNITLVKVDISLGNVDNTSDVNKPVSTATQTALNLKVNTSSVNAANGVAPLDSGSKVPVANLPAAALLSSTDSLPEGATNLYYTNTRARNAISATGRLAYTSSTGVMDLPAYSFAYPTRSLNTAFQISATRASAVHYTVDIACTLSLIGGATGTVTLRYADDSGMTTNVQTVQSFVNGNTGTLTIGLALTQTSTAALGGIIPAGKYVQILTTNTVGTPTFTYRASQEVLI